MQFYGVWAWTLITHVSVPLLVCYRFQATVCFYEMWKNCYKKNKDKDDTDIEEIELKNHVAYLLHFNLQVTVTRVVEYLGNIAKLKLTYL